MTGCGCVTLIVVGFVGLVGMCTGAEEKRKEEKRRIIAYQQEQERAVEQARQRRRYEDSVRADSLRRDRETRAQLAARNARAMEWVQSVAPELVDRLATVRQSSSEFRRLIARVQALKTENPDRVALLSDYQTRYVAVRDSLDAVASRIEQQLVDAYVHYQILNEQGGQSFSALTDRLLREAEDVLMVASEIKRSTEEQTLEAGHAP